MLEMYYAMVQTRGLHCSLMALHIHAIIILVYPILFLANLLCNQKRNSLFDLVVLLTSLHVAQTRGIGTGDVFVCCTAVGLHPEPGSVTSAWPLWLFETGPAAMAARVIGIGRVVWTHPWVSGSDMKPKEIQLEIGKSFLVK